MSVCVGMYQWHEPGTWNVHPYIHTIDTVVEYNLQPSLQPENELSPKGKPSPKNKLSTSAFGVVF